MKENKVNVDNAFWILLILKSILAISWFVFIFLTVSGIGKEEIDNPGTVAILYLSSFIMCNFFFPFATFYYWYDGGFKISSRFFFLLMLSLIGYFLCFDSLLLTYLTTHFNFAQQLINLIVSIFNKNPYLIFYLVVI